MERLRGSPETENYSHAEALWQQVLKEPAAHYLLSREERPKVTILGEKALALAYSIWKSLHEGEIAKPEIFILETNPEIAQSLQKQVPPGIETEIIPSLSQECLPPQHLVIAQNSIHKVDARSLVEVVKMVLDQRGLFFASAPDVRSLKPLLELRGNVPFRRRFWGFGLLFIFSKEALIPTPEKPKRGFRAPCAI